MAVFEGHYIGLIWLALEGPWRIFPVGLQGGHPFIGLLCGAHMDPEVHHIRVYLGDVRGECTVVEVPVEPLILSPGHAGE